MALHHATSAWSCMADVGRSHVSVARGKWLDGAIVGDVLY
jgi:hypothetical protein